MKKSGLSRVALIALALLGAAIMGYLLSLHYVPQEEAFCNLGEGLSCDIVNQSSYSSILGIPMALLGLLYFLGVAAAVLFIYGKATLRKIAFVSLAFLGPSLYLTGIEIFVLGNICVFCEASKILMVAMVAVALLALKPKDRFKGAASAVVVAILLAGATHLVFASSKPAVPSGTYDTFAQCMYERGMRMYGSVTCAFCARQREILGDSFEYIREIECDPRNPGNVAELCIAKKIERTPTWILENEAGEDVHRFEPGIQSLKALSEVSGCPLPEHPNA